uniref:Uncharacterized protein n=1 Tax=Romanomermis culicivorax TaxID=13658 RepID=A0A915JN31_ROMCU
MLAVFLPIENPRRAEKDFLHSVKFINFRLLLHHEVEKEDFLCRDDSLKAIKPLWLYICPTPNDSLHIVAYCNY